jgi:acyl carrier protein
MEESRSAPPIQTDIEQRVLATAERFARANGYTGAPFDDETRLISTGLLSSLEVIELIMEVEDEFGIEFFERELSLDILDRVGELAQAVERKLTR